MLPSAGIKASADWSQNVEAQSPCNPACSLSTLRSLMLYSNAVTDCHARLATGGWLTLARLASHQLDYSPFVWAHNSDLSFCIVFRENLLTLQPDQSHLSQVVYSCISKGSPSGSRKNVIFSPVKASRRIGSQGIPIDSNSATVSSTLST